MPTYSVTVELSELGPGALANKNERDLAGCGGHDFAALNSHIYNSNYCCRNCGGVINWREALSLGARMNDRYYAWAAEQREAA
jgi:hypothetical protein